MKSSYLAL